MFMIIVIIATLLYLYGSNRKPRKDLRIDNQARYKRKWN